MIKFLLAELQFWVVPNVLIIVDLFDLDNCQGFVLLGLLADQLAPPSKNLGCFMSHFMTVSGTTASYSGTSLTEKKFRGSAPAFAIASINAKPALIAYHFVGKRYRIQDIRELKRKRRI